MNTTGKASNATVTVDVVAPGSALVNIRGGFSARIYREDGLLYVEDTDSETLVGTARSYAKAAEKFAAHHGLTGVTVKVDYEYKN